MMTQLMTKTVTVACGVQVSPAARQTGFLDGLGNKYARLLHMNLYAGLDADSTIDLQVCQQPDGAPWVLGRGSCGLVYKVCTLKC